MIRTLRTILTASSDFIDNIVKKICIVLVGFLTVLVLVTVFFRYVFGIGIGWSDELARYVNVWMALFGASVAFKYGEHVGIEFFRNFLPDKALRIFKFLVNLVMLVLLCIAEYYCFQYFMKSRAVTPAMQIPYNWIQSSLFVGLAIMTVHLLSFIFADVDDFLSGNFSVTHEKKIAIELKGDSQ